MRRGVALGLGIALMLGAVGVTPSGAAPRQTGWRAMATEHDRQRLRAWRDAWMQGLAAARAGDGAATVAADPALFDPDRSVPDPLPPVGEYRCRAFKLGAARGVTVRPWGRCRVEAEGPLLRVSRIDGPQRPTGLIFSDTAARAILLGTMVLSDEKRSLRYGRDQARDLAGMVQRIGPARWRIVLPFPAYESVIDVVELVPVN